MENTKSSKPAGQFEELAIKMQARNSDLENLSGEILRAVRKFTPELPPDSRDENVSVQPDGILPELHRIINEGEDSVQRLRDARDLLSSLV